VLRSLLYSLFLIFHPNDAFWDLKYERRGNVPAATIILGLVVFTYIFMRQTMGFIFNPVDLTKLNIVTEMASVLVPFFLWCIVNWSLTTLMSGKGTFRDIYIASAFALTPLVIVNIPVTIVSNVLISEEGPFIAVLAVTATVWAGMLLFIGTMVTHEYDTTKTAFTCVLMVAGMTAVLFLIILFFSLVNEAVVFGSSIYREILFR
jgi:hypothetical protein